MSAPSTDRGRAGDPAPDRYAGIVLGNGSLLVFDRENPDGWVQSDTVVDLVVIQ